uniref:Uncharacterized protein n=1 Tax=Cannabis sativa TaxID=3483 RepID=A0A803QRC8_CANSA
MNLNRAIGVFKAHYTNLESNLDKLSRSRSRLQFQILGPITEFGFQGIEAGLVWKLELVRSLSHVLRFGFGSGFNFRSRSSSGKWELSVTGCQGFGVWFPFLWVSLESKISNLVGLDGISESVRSEAFDPIGSWCL